MSISVSAAASTYGAYAHAALTGKCAQERGQQAAGSQAPEAALNVKGGEQCPKKEAAERPNAMRNSHGEVLSQEDENKVRQLQQRDREVRAHEMAHVAAGGGLILRGAVYDYQTGPDSKRYAVGGDVIIDTSPARKPEDTIIKARRIRAAALAPADPSPQDRSVAQKADQMARDAQMEISARQFEKMQAQTGAPTDKNNHNDEADNVSQTSNADHKHQQTSRRIKAFYKDAATTENSAAAAIRVYA